MASPFFIVAEGSNLRFDLFLLAACFFFLLRLLDHFACSLLAAGRRDFSAGFGCWSGLDHGGFCFHWSAFHDSRSCLGYRCSDSCFGGFAG